MIGFQDYLEAKADLDSRSRSREVHAAFLDGLRARSQARVLDAGCGTGAMVRRLLEEELPCRLEIIGIDRDAESLRVARERTVAASRRAAGRAVARFVEADLLETPPAGPFDAVMAHSFMDIVPLDRVLSVVGGLLAPAGLLYATLTYDGRTTLVPAARDAGFEDELLEVYDRSMEDRRVNGGATGGSRAGARLLTAADAAGFDVIACGASDWSVYPFGGRYQGSDAVFLQAILETMRAEGARQGLEEAAMDRWMASRVEDLRACRLGLIVHQIDLLSRPQARSTRLAMPRVILEA